MPLYSLSKFVTKSLTKIKLKAIYNQYLQLQLFSFNQQIMIYVFFIILDEIDRQALRRMKGLRVSFTEREDAYILLADVVRATMKLTAKGNKTFLEVKGGDRTARNYYVFTSH